MIAPFEAARTTLGATPQFDAIISHRQRGAPIVWKVDDTSKGRIFDDARRSRAAQKLTCSATHPFPDRKTES